MGKKHELPRLHVKKLKDMYGDYNDFYEVMYGKPPETQNELQRFINYVNRGNYNLDFLFLLVTKAELKGMTLERFFLGTE